MSYTPSDVGVYADGTYGHGHCREVLADLLAGAHGGAPSAVMVIRRVRHGAEGLMIRRTDRADSGPRGVEPRSMRWNNGALSSPAPMSPTRSEALRARRHAAWRRMLRQGLRHRVARGFAPVARDSGVGLAPPDAGDFDGRTHAVAPESPPPWRTPVLLAPRWVG